MASISVVYQDDDLVVVNKPPGVLSQKDRTGDPDVVELVKQKLSQEGARDPFVGLVHRLDRPASGLMVLALRPAIAADLSEQFREHHTEKWYFALVEGKLSGIGEMEDYLTKEDASASVVDVHHPEGKLARLSWQAIAYEAPATLVHVQLKTGRSHQVRVQLSHRGHPIVGDFRYGATQELDGQNLALHAYRLAIEHPAHRKGMHWTAAPPPSWLPAFEPHIQSFL